jgi:hypothetical protein
MARLRLCWDNAVAEAFWSTLKIELVHRCTWPTMSMARQAVVEWIQSFYNLQRMHSSLGYRTPAAYEVALAGGAFPNGSSGMTQNAIAARATGATVCNVLMADQQGEAVEVRPTIHVVREGRAPVRTLVVY